MSEKNRETGAAVRLRAAAADNSGGQALAFYTARNGKTGCRRRLGRVAPGAGSQTRESGQAAGQPRATSGEARPTQPRDHRPI
jgi:hypothetical protein